MADEIGGWNFCEVYQLVLAFQIKDRCEGEKSGLVSGSYTKKRWSERDTSQTHFVDVGNGAVSDVKCFGQHCPFLL